MKKSSNTNTKNFILLDVHAIIHRAYHALPDFATSKGEPTGALYGLSTMLLKIIDELKPDYIMACYDLPKPTYRHEAYKEYKAGRAKTDEALVAQLKKSRSLFEALDIPMYSIEGFEADDMIGTLSTLLAKDKNNQVIIASGDMDTLQLVKGDQVRVYTLKKGIKDTIIYNEKAVKERFGFGPELLPDYKGLRGDPSDNIIGIKGIGEKTAGILIQSFGTLENMYKKLKKSPADFRSAGLTERLVGLIVDGEEEAMFSKMLATIRRDAPIDFVLPEKTWRDGVEFEKINKLWIELEFRTLGSRLKDVLNGKAVTSVKKENIANVNEKEGDQSNDAKNGGTAGTAELGTLFNTLSPEEEKMLRESEIMLWIINSNLANPKLEDVLNFTGAKNIADAHASLLKEIREKKLDKVFAEIEKPLISIVKKMQERGIVVDKNLLEKLSKIHHKELADLESKIWKIAGEEFNINSPKQMGEVLFVKMGLKVKNQKKTASGQASTKESELEKMRDLSPIIPLILSYRELQKMLSTYIDNIPNMVAFDGRLHPRFLQTGTTTGRMSSADPNIQNIPNRTDLGREIRQAFRAGEGCKLVAFDYSQMELRIAAFLSGDKKLIEIFKNGEDVHTAVAAEVFDLEPEKVDKEMRRRAKIINFGIMYGMGVNALRQSLGTDRAEAQKFYDEYFEKFSGLAKYLEETKASALRLGYTETFFGRRRYFEGLRSKLPFIRAMAERMAINAPIQGTEADIVKLSMIRVEEFLDKNKQAESAHLLLQVHDELVYEIKESEIKKLVPEIKEIMENIIDPKETSGIKCLVEAAVGDNWGEMKKIL
jgi:DNA polymerase-1